MALKVHLSILPDSIPATPEELEANTRNYPESYVRVLYVRSMPAESFIFVCWYENEAARQAEADPIKVYEYKAPTAALTGDVYPAAYSYLKTLPEFEGAIDC